MKIVLLNEIKIECFICKLMDDDDFRNDLSHVQKHELKFCLVSWTSETALQMEPELSHIKSLNIVSLLPNVEELLQIPPSPPPPRS